MEAKTNSGYITIAEYAQRRGVSVAAVYKRLDGTLKKYYKEIDGQKFLSVDVLAAEGITPVEKGYKPGLNTQEAQDAGKPGENTEAPASQEQTPPAVLVALDVLEKQLAEQQRLLAEQQRKLKEVEKEKMENDINDVANKSADLIIDNEQLKKKIKDNDDFKDQLQKFIKDYITDEEDG